MVDATKEGGRVIVDVRQPKGQGWHIGPSPSARLIVSLPATTDLIAKSGDGSIDVERLAGRLELGSGDGSIRARDLSGDVNAHTGDGSIVLDGKFASLRARSGDGSVRIRAAAGSTTGGDWDVTTGDGSITLEIPDGFSGELDAHTGDGRVHLEDVNVDTGGSQTGRNSLRGRVGSGGRQIRLRTGDGSITLRR